jgi:hypothetical protein
LALLQQLVLLLCLLSLMLKVPNHQRSAIFVPKEPTRKVDSDPKKVSPAINPNTGKVSPSLGNIPGKGGLKKPSAEDFNFYCPKNGAIKKGTNNNRPSN